MGFIFCAILKKICLIRDFGKKWKDFLKTDIHPAVKHWLWIIVTQQLSSPYEKTIEETQLENYKAQLELYGIENEEEVRKINKNLKDVRSKIRKDLNYKPQSNLSPYGKELRLAFKKYNECYSSLIIRYMKTNDELWDTVKEILQSVLLEYPEALEEIGEYIDISSQKTDGLGIKYKLPEDKEEKIFKSITSIRYDRLLEKTIKNKDKKIEDFINLNNFINVHRYHLREVSVIVNQIPEPKWVLFTKPRLESLKEDIKKKVKTKYNENEYEALFDNIIRYCPVLNREFYLEKINGKKNSYRNRTAN